MIIPSLKSLFNNKINDGYKSLCLMLSATLGTGNIIGIAIAIKTAGPGVLFWLIVFGIISLTTKYLEAFLAVKWQLPNKRGPFAYMARFGKLGVFLTLSFAFFTITAGLLGVGTLTQSSSMAEAFQLLFQNDSTIIKIIISIVITGISILIIFGGKKKILNSCTLIVPIMAVVYVGMCLSILIVNYDQILNVFSIIIKDAFYVSTPDMFLKSGLGLCMFYGIRRCVLATEAGLGTCALAFGANDLDEPIKQGKLATGGMLITLLICFLTGMVVIISGVYKTDLTGLNIANMAFLLGLNADTMITTVFLCFVIFFFGLTSIVGWNLYTSIALEALTSNKYIKHIYNAFYIIAIFLGGIISVGTVFKIADVSCLLMALPNLIAILISINKLTKGELIDENWQGGNQK